jgi:hypothetical protein
MLACHAGYAQCNEEMYQLALSQVGKEVVLVRDFKVKLREGNKRNPSPASKFSVLMQNGITYRFSIAKDKTSTVEPVLQLFDKNELLFTTFDVKQGKSVVNYDYLCNRTGSYQVILSMHENKAGCAIGIMAMVADSAFYAQGNNRAVDEKYILYAGVETPINYTTDQTAFSRVRVTIDRGEIIEKNSTFYALVPTVGPAKIKITLFNNTDSILENSEQEFKVIDLPEPEVSIRDVDNEYITAVSLGNNLRLKITPEIYQIIEFYIEDIAPYGSYKSNSEFLTIEMLNFIKSLGPNKPFYLNRIKVAKPDGSVMYLKRQIYYMR